MPHCRRLSPASLPSALFTPLRTVLLVGWVSLHGGALPAWAALPQLVIVAQHAPTASNDPSSVAKSIQNIAADTEPAVELDADLFHDLFTAELLARTGQLLPASDLLLDVARATDSPALYRRAADFALRAQSGAAALAAARAWLRAYPQSRMANRYVLEILISLNKIQESKTPLEREIAATPAAERPESFHHLARLYYNAGNRAAAANLFEAALTPYLKQPHVGGSAWAAVGQLRAVAGQKSLAERALDKAQALDPFGAAPAFLAFTLLEMQAKELGKNPNNSITSDVFGQQARSIVEGHLARALAANLRIGYGRLLGHMASPQDALAVLAPLLQPLHLPEKTEMASNDARTITANPDELAADEGAMNADEENVAIINALDSGVDVDDEKTQQNQLLSLIHHADANLIAAALYGQQGNWDGLLAAIEQIERIAPHLPRRLRRQEALDEAFALAARAALHQQNGANALIWLDKIKLGQDQFFVQLLRARAHYLSQNPQMAMEVLESSHTQNDEQYQAKERFIVQMLDELGQLKAAWQRQNLLSQRYPEDAEIAYDAAILAEKSNQFNEMERILRALIARHPDYYHAHNALGYALADRGKSLMEAHDLIAYALSRAPNDPHILDSMGWVQYRLGNRERALEILEAAHAQSPDPEIAAHLGEVLWVQGQRDRAREIWHKALERAPQNATLLSTMKRLNTQ